VSFPRFFKDSPARDYPSAKAANSANRETSTSPEISNLSRISRTPFSGSGPAESAPEPSNALDEALDRIAEAIAASPRSPVLNDLALSHAAQALIKATRIIRTLPLGVRHEALGVCGSASRTVEDAIRRRDYKRAYRLLDELPGRLQMLKPN